MSLPFRLSNIHNGDAVDIKRKPGAVVPEPAAPAPAAAVAPTPVAPAAAPQTAPAPAPGGLVFSDEERMQRLAQLQEQERLAAARIEEENRLAAERARQEQERRIREEEARKREEEEIARRLREKEARLMKEWKLDDDSLMAQVAQQMSTEMSAERPAESTEMKDDSSSSAPAAATATPEVEKQFDINAVSVFKPGEGSTRPAEMDDIPDDFYELTVDDLRAVRESEKQAKEGSGVLMTREMRERQRQKKWAAFTTCSLRIRLPDRVELMNVFPSTSHICDLYSFVKQCMADPNTSFELYTTPPLTVLSNMNATFIDSRLVPAAIVHLRWTGATAAKPPSSKDALRADLLEKIQSGLPQATPAAAPKSDAASKKKPDEAKPVCSICFSSSVRLAHCMECDNNFCTACWNLVHDPSENAEMARHHKGEVRPSSSTASSAFSASEPTRQSPRTGGSDTVASSKMSRMPKWFQLGKKY